MTVTDMVRCRSLVEQTRVLMVEVLSGEVDEEDDEDEEDEGDDDDDDIDNVEGGLDAAAQRREGYGDQTSMPSWDIDEERLHLDAARIYENTIVQLGERLFYPLTSDNVPSNDIICSPMED